MALIKCTNCGQIFSNKAKMCPNCGSPNDSIRNNKYGILHINWKGAQMLFDANVDVFVNGGKMGSFSFEKGFSIDIQILSEEMEVEIKYGFRTAKHLFSFVPNMDYKCELVYSRVSGAFGLQMEDKNGNITTDNLSFLGASLCFIIPIVGILYAFYVKKDKPTTFQTALIMSICGFILWIFVFPKLIMLL